MKSPILFDLKEIPELFDAFKELIRTKALYDSSLENLTNYTPTFFKIITKSNARGKLFHIKKHDLIAQSTGFILNEENKQNHEFIRFCKHWAQANKTANNTASIVRIREKQIMLEGCLEQKFNDSRIFVNTNTLLVGKTAENLSIQETLKKYPEAIEELIHLVLAIENYNAQTRTFRNKTPFITYFRETHLRKHHGPFLRQNMAAPIIKIMELTRKLLSKTLLTHFMPEIIAKQNEEQNTDAPEFFLKNNKNEIFNLAEKTNLIPDANALIKLHDLRDALAHPDTSKHVAVEVPETTEEIYETILNLMRHITKTNDLSVREIPENMSIEEFKFYLLITEGRKAKTENTIQVVNKDQDLETPIFLHNMEKIDEEIKKRNPIDANGKPLKPKKFPSWLVNQGVLTEAERKDFESSRTLRNDVCHGNATQSTHSTIVSRTAKTQQLVNAFTKNNTQNQNTI